MLYYLLFIVIVACITMYTMIDFVSSTYNVSLMPETTTEYVSLLLAFLLCMIAAPLLVIVFLSPRLLAQAKIILIKKLKEL